MSAPELSARMQLEEIYSRIPDIECKGLCARSCGPILVGLLEAARLPGPHRRVRTPSGLLAAEIPHVEKHHRNRGTRQQCIHLRNGRCTVHTLRPAICRIWGVSQDMRCPHGCEPERWLTPEEANALIREVTLLVELSP